jgi:hypothetical protein
MTATRWWLRIVGGFYLAATAINLYAMLINPQLLPRHLAFPDEDVALGAFTDAWLVFVLELGALGAVMLYASREPEHSGILVLAIVVAEIFHGVIADASWIVRGYSPAIYVPFILLHLLIIATGVFLLRGPLKERDGAAISVG